MLTVQDSANVPFEAFELYRSDMLMHYEVAVRNLAFLKNNNVSFAAAIYIIRRTELPRK